MVYADTDFFVALVKENDWLGENAEILRKEYAGDIETSLPTFIELFLLSERYGFDREGAAAHMMEVAETDFDENTVFQASEYVEEGLNVFDAFQAAFAGSRIISSDKSFDLLNLERIRLENQ